MVGNAKPILKSLKMNYETLGDLVRPVPYSQRRLIVVTVGRFTRMWMILRVIECLKALSHRSRREMVVKHIVQLAGGLWLVMVLSTQ